MRLVADPRELVAAVGDDVVRVDAVEPGCGRAPGERRLREERSTPPACSALFAAAQSATGRSSGR